MKKAIIVIQFLITGFFLQAQPLISVFEKTNGTQSATYKETIEFYTELAKRHPALSVKTFGKTDSGHPLHLIIFSRKDKGTLPKNKVVVLINNGIHPGEPDGIDATMMLLRDMVSGKINVPQNVVIGIIPVYNIGGALNRNSTSRVNQNGPAEYGFRGNAQNLDLNRDFTKADSKNAAAFAEIFHFIKPQILIDNHVSDGADHQHTMTLISTQHNKLGASLGTFLHQTFDPAIYHSMGKKKWEMVPYVNFEDATPEKGWAAFYDPPRYSSGYAALFQTISFMPETHMLKKYSDRVHATYTLMQTIIALTGKYSAEILQEQATTRRSMIEQKNMPLSWKLDSLRYDSITFNGFEAGYKKSDVTGMQRMFYDQSKPFTRQVSFYNYFVPDKIVTAPKAYIIPQGWHKIIDRLRLNGVVVNQLLTDTTLKVEVYKIADYKSTVKPYEGHHKNFDVEVDKEIKKINFLKGDYVIHTSQPAKRYIIEMLEPEGDDSFFAWNFFDAILQQKEGYSDYRWEDVAAEFLELNPAIRDSLEQKKKTDSSFAASSRAQLYFVYTHSPYYEPAHNRYPVYRLN
jgi:hypothetical protein